jgi:hypothetical protein
MILPNTNNKLKIRFVLTVPAGAIVRHGIARHSDGSIYVTLRPK